MKKDERLLFLQEKLVRMKEYEEALYGEGFCYIAGIDEAGIGIYLPEIYRLRGACLLALDRHNKVEARSAFVIAVDIAKRQGAVIFQRRAEASLSEFAT